MGEVRKCLAEVKALLKSVAPRPASDSKDKNGAASKEKSPRRLVSKVERHAVRSASPWRGRGPPRAGLAADRHDAHYRLRMRFVDWPLLGRGWCASGPSAAHRRA